ncbi:MAG TPA: HAMP domain-containing sensor histidine kinase [Bacteroidales bacterium]|nr:HAMP domain-containing sensor histidine kinase [Bacteroidales bacterium]
MILKKIRYFSPLLFLFISALLLFLAYSFSGGKSIKSEKQINAFKTSLEKAVTETDSLLNWASNPMFLNDPFSILSVGSFVDKTRSLNATVFISHNDSLIFWSDNRTPLPPDIDTLQSGNLVQSGNGVYLLRAFHEGSYRFFSLMLLQSSYFYQNNYLISGVNPCLCDDCRFQISSDQTMADTLIRVDGVSPLMPLVFSKDDISLSSAQDVAVVLFLFFALVFLAMAFYGLASRLALLKHTTWLRLVYFALIPLVLYFFGQYLFSLNLFDQLSVNNPAFFAYSGRFPNLTPLLLYAFLFVLWISFFSHELLLIAGRKRKNVFQRLAFLFITYITTATLAYFVISGINSFLFNTSINFTFNNVLAIDIRSVLLLLTLFLLFCGIILLHYLMISLVSRLRLSFKTWLVVSVVFLLIGALTALIAGFNVWLFVSVSVYLLLMQFVFSRHMYSNRTVYLLLNIALAAGISTVSLNYAIQQKQYDQLKLLSLNLATEQDPLTEEFLGDLIPQISQDSILLNDPYRMIEEFNLTQYLKRKYFNGYLGQYILQTTWCRPGEEILVQPSDTAISCIGFFDDVAFRMGIPALSDNVVFVNDGTGRGYYLCKIRLDAPGDTSYIFAELIPASYEKGLGYPDLLVDVNSGIKTVPSNIAYARYLDDGLVSRYGKFNYPTRISALFNTMPDEKVIHDHGYIHFKLTISDRLVLIITESDRDIPSSLAPFSYILLFFGVLVVLFLLIAGRVFGFRLRFAVSFSSRLQWMIILIILVIFFVAGVISVLNLQSLNKSKNEEIVSEKAHSLVVELEHKLSQYGPLSFADEQYVTELLLKFSQVFFTDLNVYSLNGKLLATTRPQIFDKELISVRMNADAYAKLSQRNHSFLLITEHIGEMAFMSVYIPVRNDMNENIAYLNLPYFARENELSREISSFISTFINIYMLIILLTVLITVVVSNYVTQPLRLIKDKLRNIKLGTLNEKIKWKRRDEIGDLVFEYNRMIEELAYKADLLARSEREMAWREMAKQVAHEIKNPLTPMKLSTQYLEKAWNDNAEDFDERLKRYSQIMVEQIDSLSDIATAFSHFGKMPESTVVKICLNDVLSSVITLYRSEDYDITLQVPDTALYVFADESQMLRVFNNLLKNAQQAFVPARRGMIHVTLKVEENKALVVVQDNGAGMSEEQKKKIFQPNFTTKSSGTGLGLAMVKNIVSGFGGRIWFESVENVGTTFSVELPLAE